MPPALQTFVARICGPPEQERLTPAQKFIDIVHHTSGIAGKAKPSNRSLTL